jgi:hypothetical protein
VSGMIQDDQMRAHRPHIPAESGSDTEASEFLRGKNSDT